MKSPRSFARTCRAGPTDDFKPGPATGNSGTRQPATGNREPGNRQPATGNRQDPRTGNRPRVLPTAGCRPRAPQDLKTPRPQDPKTSRPQGRHDPDVLLRSRHRGCEHMTFRRAVLGVGMLWLAAVAIAAARGRAAEDRVGRRLLGRASHARTGRLRGGVRQLPPAGFRGRRLCPRTGRARIRLGVERSVGRRSLRSRPAVDAAEQSRRASRRRPRSTSSLTC